MENGELRIKNEELYLKLPRRGKSLVTPHKAKPQCGGQRTSDEGAQCGAKTHKRRRSAVWRREEESRKSQIA